MGSINFSPCAGKDWTKHEMVSETHLGEIYSCTLKVHVLVLLLGDKLV